MRDDKFANYCDTNSVKLKFAGQTNGTVGVDSVDCFGRGFDYRRNFHVRFRIVLLWHRCLRRRARGRLGFGISFAVFYFRRRFNRFDSDVANDFLQVFFT